MALPPISTTITGVPVAATENVTGFPRQTAWLTGCRVTAGATLTVSVATSLVSEPHVLVTTTS